MQSLVNTLEKKKKKHNAVTLGEGEGQPEGERDSQAGSALSARSLEITTEAKLRARYFTHCATQAPCPFVFTSCLESRLFFAKACLWAISLRAAVGFPEWVTKMLMSSVACDSPEHVGYLVLKWPNA